MPLLDDLNAYAIRRTATYEKYKLQYYYGFFSFIANGIPYNEKKTAWEKLKNAINNPQQEFNFEEKDLAALRDGELFTTINKYRSEWPRCFKIQFESYEQLLIDRARLDAQRKHAMIMGAVMIRV